MSSQHFYNKAYLTEEETQELLAAQKLPLLKVNTPDFATTALHTVVALDREDLFLKMWERGYPGIIEAIPNKKPHTLHWAVLFNSLQILECMFKRGIEINTSLVPSLKGDKKMQVLDMLHIARPPQGDTGGEIRDSLAALKLLIQYGADIYRQPGIPDGSTVFSQVCSNYGFNTELFDYLMTELKAPHFTAPFLAYSPQLHKSLFEITLEEKGGYRAKKIIEATPTQELLAQIIAILDDVLTENNHVVVMERQDALNLQQYVKDKRLAIGQKFQLENAIAPLDKLEQQINEKRINKI